MDHTMDKKMNNTKAHNNHTNHYNNGCHNSYHTSRLQHKYLFLHRLISSRCFQGREISQYGLYTDNPDIAHHMQQNLQDIDFFHIQKHFRLCDYMHPRQCLHYLLFLMTHRHYPAQLIPV